MNVGIINADGYEISTRLKRVAYFTRTAGSWALPLGACWALPLGLFWDFPIERTEGCSEGSDEVRGCKLHITQTETHTLNTD